MRLIFAVLSGLMLAGCGTQAPQPPDQIALLAPFEGRYRDLGYSLLYPARLAVADSGVGVALLPVDDGGAVQLATERARALQLDERVQVVIIAGYTATAADVIDALAGKPVIVVGHWAAEPAEHVAILSSADLTVEPLTITRLAAEPAPLRAGDVAGLPGLTDLRDDMTGVTLVTSGDVPDEALRQRVLASDPFAVEPNQLAALVYDAVWIAGQIMPQADPITALRTGTFDGLSGGIRFDDAGYWADAPVNTFIYRQGAWVSADD